jgi:hypothetical protein
MVVSVATYSLPAGWTYAALADSLFGAAFAAAGLMAPGGWHDQFVTGSNTVRVLRVPHDSTKTYGATFYYLVFRSSDAPGIALASGWNTTTKVPTGTQYLDYHTLPSAISQTGSNFGASRICPFTPQTNTVIHLDRYTSEFDTKQSWFVLRQGLNRSPPFTILHQNTILQPWVDLSRGLLNGYATVQAFTSGNMGVVSFQFQENLRRCLMSGSALRSDVDGAGAGRYHGVAFNTQCYAGVGSAPNATSSNLSSGFTGSNGSAFLLPIGKTSANGEFLTDYAPIVSDMGWWPVTPTRLASDFGIYFHYADNTSAYGDQFNTPNGLTKWAVLQFANNATVTDGASAHFLASVPLNWTLPS